ncbi:secretory phospholipase A2 receptor-like [Epinephelus fuscoguttatus]|uniref:secretory phospholipase A2 receptor-like n=1 Tax=Epinephelus fuscoguttatus TaxID=293821 RepID=UPI0020D16C89|nr:secretory phospholipase A2 receptor-like [Epinephelus fuscoguttatus]
MRQYHAWIGFYRNTPDSSWTWTWSGWSSLTSYNNFDNWAQNEPHNSETCATVYYDNIKFYGHECGGYFFFFCHKHPFNPLKYTFVPKSMSWSDARRYCQSLLGDLATFTNISFVSSAVYHRDFPVWTGLHRDGGIWKWSAGVSEYRKWASDEPGNNGDCVTISSTQKKMATQDCSARFPFVCLRDNLVLVKENKTWEEALEHCRALRSPTYYHLRYELVSVQSGQDHSYIITRIMEADTEEVWAGLRFLAGHWLWVNSVSMSYSDLPVCPPEGQHCGALSKNDTGSMKIIDCAERRNFLCYSTS